jgi:hypothetical protein
MTKFITSTARIQAKHIIVVLCSLSNCYDIKRRTEIVDITTIDCSFNLLKQVDKLLKKFKNVSVMACASEK